MPYASKAQQRFFHSPDAKAKGISEKTVAEFDVTTKGKALPERIGKTSKQKSIAKLARGMQGKKK